MNEVYYDVRVGEMVGETDCKFLGTEVSSASATLECYDPSEDRFEHAKLALHDLPRSAGRALQ